MSFYKTNNVLALTTGQSGSLPNAWGILPVSGATGTLQLERRNFATGSYTTMSIAHIAAGVPFPCFVTGVSVTAGTVYVLA
jgi:hypothetical protein